jgi:hypothetical protein
MDCYPSLDVETPFKGIKLVGPLLPGGAGI